MIRKQTWQELFIIWAEEEESGASVKKKKKKAMKHKEW